MGREWRVSKCHVTSTASDEFSPLDLSYPRTHAIPTSTTNTRIDKVSLLRCLLPPSTAVVLSEVSRRDPGTPQWQRTYVQEPYYRIAEGVTFHSRATLADKNP